MAETTLTVVARIKAKAGMEARVHEELHKLLAPTRQEAGCLNFDMHVATESPGDFLFYENWTTEELWRAHINAPHIQAWLKLSDQLCADPVAISLWKPVA
jgi:quinol monooxygenase YgiN